MSVTSRARKRNLVRGVLLAAASVASLVIAGPAPERPVPTHQVQPPTRPMPPAQVLTAARNEIDRVAEAEASTRRTHGRAGWDGINRKSGDRAHKRFKARRARGGK